MIRSRIWLESRCVADCIHIKRRKSSISISGHFSAINKQMNNIVNSLANSDNLFEVDQHNS